MTHNQTDQELREGLLSLRFKTMSHSCTVNSDGKRVEMFALNDVEVNQVIALIKADRQKTLTKLSFHVGVPTDVLQGYLEAKD